MTITLYNTATRSKQPLEPIEPGKVSMYVCGPTVYDRAHIGNARAVVVFDMLYRLLRHEYGADAVTYVRNFTDVDDKINARAAEESRPISEITEETTQWFLDDMAAIGALKPNEMPRATAYVPHMVKMIEGLIEKGHAYAAEGHVLFKVRSYDDYGKLSGRSVDDMIAGARVEVAPYKEDPMDFVLWKPSDDATPGWDSPWGRGRPGWHIECSAMAYELLGDRFDIHGGGNDLTFPHHENEIAQSKCAGHGFANIWMHNEMLQVEGKKMSKSLGNFFTIRDLLDQGVPGEVIRFVMLSTHYRKPMDWTEKKANEAIETLRKFSGAAIEEPTEEVNEDFVFELSDDLNTSEAIKLLHEYFDTDNRQQLNVCARLLGFDLWAISQSDWARPFEHYVKADQKYLVEGTDYMPTVGVLGWGPIDDKLRDAAISVLHRWLALRRDQDWTRADELKNSALAAGLGLRATRSANGVNGGIANVSSWQLDPTKLEALI